jgi:hypothetical protein
MRKRPSPAIKKATTLIVIGDPRRATTLCGAHGGENAFLARLMNTAMS